MFRTLGASTSGLWGSSEWEGIGNTAETERCRKPLWGQQTWGWPRGWDHEQAVRNLFSLRCLQNSGLPIFHPWSRGRVMHLSIECRCVCWIYSMHTWRPEIDFSVYLCYCPYFLSQASHSGVHLFELPSRCRDKKPWRETARGRKSLFGSEFQAPVHCCGEVKDGIKTSHRGQERRINARILACLLLMPDFLHFYLGVPAKGVEPPTMNCILLSINNKTIT